MQLDHLAIAVRSVEAAADRFCTLIGYRRKTEAVVNTRHRVRVLFLTKPGSIDLKLIEPSDPESPLVDFVRKGGGLHHVAFKAPDVAAAVEALAGQGVRVLSPPAPGEAFDDHPIAFCYLGFGVNAEIIDTDARRALVESAGV